MRGFFILLVILSIFSVPLAVRGNPVTMEVYVRMPSSTTTLLSTTSTAARQPSVIGNAVSDRPTTTSIPQATITYDSETTTLPAAKVTFVAETSTTMAYAEVPKIVAAKVDNQTVTPLDRAVVSDNLATEAQTEPTGIIAWFAGLFKGWF